MSVGFPVALELKDSCLTNRGDDEPATKKLHMPKQSSPDETDRPPEHKVKQLTMLLLLYLPQFVYTAGLVHVILILGVSLRQSISNK